ncbi:MAG: hypothetical protein H7235_06725 [Bdellovibrionaceae bacterium]|nr:hypothetical protein [Pseudobdellovibrionaceae bacterium]
MPSINNKKGIAVVALIVIWGIYNLAVLLKTGFMSDDAYNSQIKGQILEQGISLNERILAEAFGWLKGSGRLMIVSWYMTYGIYYFTQDPIIVKALNITIILIGILFFYTFSKKETGSPYLALLACLLIPSFFQFRMWHDPIMAFTFLIPAIFTLTMGALVFFQKFLHSGKVYYCGIAFCFYLAALLIYEISYVLCLLFVVIAYMHSRNIIKAIKLSLPFTAATALLICISAFFRLYAIKNSSNPQSTYPAAELHLNIDRVISAFEIQALSSVPLNYFFFNKENLALVFQKFDYLFFAAFGIGLSILFYKIGRNTVTFKLASWTLCGGVLLLAPAALTSLSGHQVDLIKMGYGFGYIPVYLQYFGLCIIVVASLSVIATKIKWRFALAIFSIVVSVGATVVTALNLGLNRAVALKMNETYKYPADLLKAALKAGLVKDMKDGAFIFRTTRYPSDYTWFYRIGAEKKLELCELFDVVKYKLCIEKLHPAQITTNTKPSSESVEIIDLSKQDAWILSYNFEKKSGKTGQVIFSKIERIVQNSKSNTLIQVLVNEIKVYDLKEDRIRKLDLQSLPANFLTIIEDQTVDMAEVQPFDPASLLARDVDFEWLGKIYGREGTNQNNLRWSSGSAILTLHNISSKPKHITITMEIGTPTVEASEMIIKYPAQTERITLGLVPMPYSKTILIAPGQTEVTFTSNAEPIRNGDPRNIVFGIFNFKIKSIK